MIFKEIQLFICQCLSLFQFEIFFNSTLHFLLKDQSLYYINLSLALVDLSLDEPTMA
jgi:hypothetical protein